MKISEIKCIKKIDILKSARDMYKDLEQIEIELEKDLIDINYISIRIRSDKIIMKAVLKKLEEIRDEKAD